jgi:hypothetical protein
MSTRNLPRGEGWRARSDLTTICEPIAYRKYGSLDVSQPYWPSRPVTGITLPFYNVEEKRNAHGILVGNPEVKRPLGRPRRMWEVNIKIDVRETG